MVASRLARALCACALLQSAEGWAPAPMWTVRHARPLRRAQPLLSTAASEGAADRERKPWLKATISQMQGKLRQARQRGQPSPEWVRRVLKLLVRLRSLLPFLIFAVLLAIRASGGSPRSSEVPFSAFMSLVAEKSPRLEHVRISASRIGFSLDGRPAFARTPRTSYDLVSFMHRSGIDFAAAPISTLAALLPLAFPILWLAALYSVMRKQLTGATRSVGKRASAKLDPTELSFEDVAGVSDAIVEVREIVGMLQDPSLYDKVGARLPAGVLMVGPPGTGKTLLARVMAAQARVPFFYCSGSDFVELFVGRGAARMRALFKEASEAAPCIIFVDELDALGKQRAMRMAGNDEVEQTLNQMLACMDGLETKKGVVVMAATNRYEILDQALTRPGRFDRLVRSLVDTAPWPAARAPAPPRPPGGSQGPGRSDAVRSTATPPESAVWPQELAFGWPRAEEDAAPACPPTRCASTCPTKTAASPSSRCTRASCASTRTCGCRSSRPRRAASRAPSSLRCATRRPSAPRAASRSSSTCRTLRRCAAAARIHPPAARACASSGALECLATHRPSTPHGLQALVQYTTARRGGPLGEGLLTKLMTGA